ncbi:MAG: leader peptide processing enzyme [Treponema sp.]|nr:leader peptide processing enzyme [Treponema sp.]
MNKKVNTVLFLLGATLFNVIVAVLSIFLLIILYSISPLRNMISESGQGWVTILIFISGIAISMFVYRVVLKLLLKKIDVEKYFDPLFVSRYKKP